eukprot:COSAG06_NODE_41113_length_395_cov_0.513514_1_plen_25_part_01
MCAAFVLQDEAVEVLNDADGVEGAV